MPLKRPITSLDQQIPSSLSYQRFQKSCLSTKQSSFASFFSDSYQEHKVFSYFSHHIKQFPRLSVPLSPSATVLISFLFTIKLSPLPQLSLITVSEFPPFIFFISFQRGFSIFMKTVHKKISSDPYVAKINCQFLILISHGLIPTYDLGHASRFNTLITWLPVHWNSYSFSGSFASHLQPFPFSFIPYLCLSPFTVLLEILSNLTILHTSTYR